MKAAFIIGLLALTATVLCQEGKTWTLSTTKSIQYLQRSTSVHGRMAQTSPNIGTNGVVTPSGIGIGGTPATSQTVTGGTTLVTTTVLNNTCVGTYSGGTTPAIPYVCTAPGNGAPVVNITYVVSISYAYTYAAPYLCNYTANVFANTSMLINSNCISATTLTNTYPVAQQLNTAANTQIKQSDATLSASLQAAAFVQTFTFSSQNFIFISYTNVTPTTTSITNTSSASVTVYNCNAGSTLLTTYGPTTCPTYTAAYIATVSYGALVCATGVVQPPTTALPGVGSTATTTCSALVSMANGSTAITGTAAAASTGVNTTVSQQSVQITTTSPVVVTFQALPANTSTAVTSTVLATTTCVLFPYSTPLPPACSTVTATTATSTVVSQCMQVTVMVNGTNGLYQNCTALTTACTVSAAGVSSCGTAMSSITNSTVPIGATAGVAAKSASNILVAIQCTLFMIFAMML